VLATLPPDRLVGHLRRHGFSPWIAGVFRDPVLTKEVRTAEQRIDAGSMATCGAVAASPPRR
jgi:hypothetical protein